MRLLTNLLFKVTLSSMILTAPAMITAKNNYDGASTLSHRREGPIPFFTATVIKRFVDHPTVIAMRSVPLDNTAAVATATGATLLNAVSNATAAAALAAEAGNVAIAVTERSVESKPAESKVVESKSAVLESAETRVVESKSAVLKSAETRVAESKSAVSVSAETRVAESKFVVSKSADARAADAKSAELRMVIRQASLIYTAMDLQESGLDAKAFEYAWRGYHNLVKKGAIQKKAILSICDFSQSSRNKRMYVIDVEHKKLLYRTYVAHGQNSGDEFASSFSNQNDSYKSSLGFYITQKTYVGRNGLSLRLYGVDQGYNDQAMKRKIVLHGSPYVGDKYMQEYGNLGTSLGCPALPVEVSGRIIRTVKDGSCLFIYHPTQQYLDNSTILHG